MDRWIEAMAEEGEQSLRDRSRPIVTASFASSLDGCIAAARGERTTISGPESLELTHKLRAAHDAILVGVGTVLVDDPLLTTRLVEGPSPLRIILDSMLRSPPEARIFSEPQPPVLVFSGPEASASRRREFHARGVEVRPLSLDGTGSGVCLRELVSELGRRGVRSLMVEGGARVLASFFAEGLVDHVCLTEAPVRLSSNPDAVRLEGHSVASLKAWTPSFTRHYGRDTVRAGPLGLSALDGAR